MEITQIINDSYGKERNVVHFLVFITEADSQSIGYDNPNRIDLLYKMALKKAKAMGGKKYHNKSYGGGIVFSNKSASQIEKEIKSLLKNNQ